MEYRPRRARGARLFLMGVALGALGAVVFQLWPGDDDVAAHIFDERMEELGLAYEEQLAAASEAEAELEAARAALGEATDAVARAEERTALRAAERASLAVHILRPEAYELSSVEPGVSSYITQLEASNDAWAAEAKALRVENGALRDRAAILESALSAADRTILSQRELLAMRQVQLDTATGEVERRRRVANRGKYGAGAIVLTALAILIVAR